MKKRQPHSCLAAFAVSLLMLVGLLPSCSLKSGTAATGNHPTWQRIPVWAQQRVQKPWWTSYGDTTLNHQIRAGLASNPDIAAIAARLDRAEAQLGQVGAAAKPRFNLGIGWRDGREREMDFGPYDLAPWQSGGQLSWEIDLTGKLLAATRSARYARDAAFWDVHAARLQLASQIASTHFLIVQLNGDLKLARQISENNKELVALTRSQFNAGIISNTQLSRMQAQQEQSLRAVQELERLRSLAMVQLRTLAPTNTSNITAQSRLPVPDAFSNLGINQLLASHPTLLAAEARVRSAFQLQKSAKLNLLPSFRLNASALGAGQSLNGKYRVWQHSVGPSLDIPIYDPVRLAQLKVRKAEAQEAAAQYRAAANKVLGEIDSTRVNFLNRKKQLSSAQREVAAMERAHRYAESRFAQGIVAKDEPLTAKQQLLAAKLKLRDLQHTLLIDHISLTKSLGGG